MSGDSLETLVVEIGGAGHRGRLVLRTAGDAPFDWTIGPFETGVAHFGGLPASPKGWG